MVEDALDQSTTTTAASLKAATFRSPGFNPVGALGMFDFAGRAGFGPMGAHQIPDERKWQMLCDPQVYASLFLRRGTTLFDGVQVNSARQYGEDRYDRALRWKQLCLYALGTIERGLYANLMELQEADWWQNIVADCIWTEKTWDSKQWLVPGVFDIHHPCDYTLYRRDGRIIGVGPAIVGNVVATTDQQVYEAEKFLIYCFRPNSRQWAGTDLARVVWIPYWMKNQGHPENLKYLALFSNPSFVGTAPEDAPKEVPLLDHRGQPLRDPETSQVKMVSPQAAMSAGLENFAGGGSYTVIPPKAKMALMEAQGDGRLFVTFEDSRDWQIMVGILGTGNMTGRAKYGSNASAQTGQSAVEMPANVDAQVLADQLTALCRLIVRENARSESEIELAPTVTLGDPNRDYLEKLFLSFMANSDAPDERMIGEFAERLGVPSPNLDTLKERLAQSRQQNAANTVPGSTSSK